MSNTKDYQAEYGYQPAWDLQRKKQESVAENVYERRDKKEARNAEDTHA